MLHNSNANGTSPKDSTESLAPYAKEAAACGSGNLPNRRGFPAFRANTVQDTTDKPDTCAETPRKIRPFRPTLSSPPPTKRRSPTAPAHNTRLTDPRPSMKGPDQSSSRSSWFSRSSCRPATDCRSVLSGARGLPPLATYSINTSGTSHCVVSPFVYSSPW